jgi:hypothetical protein
MAPDMRFLRSTDKKTRIKKREFKDKHHGN